MKLCLYIHLLIGSFIVIMGCGRSVPIREEPLTPLQAFFADTALRPYPDEVLDSPEWTDLQWVVYQDTQLLRKNSKDKNAAELSTSPQQAASKAKIFIAKTGKDTLFFDKYAKELQQDLAVKFAVNSDCILYICTHASGKVAGVKLARYRVETGKSISALAYIKELGKKCANLRCIPEYRAGKAVTSVQALTVSSEQ